MNAYVTADTKGDQDIRSVALVTMMNYQRRTLATTTAAKAVPHEHPLAQTAEKSAKNDAVDHSMNDSNQEFSALFGCRRDRERTVELQARSPRLGL